MSKLNQEIAEEVVREAFRPGGDFGPVERSYGNKLVYLIVKALAERTEAAAKVADKQANLKITMSWTGCATLIATSIRREL